MSIEKFIQSVNNVFKIKNKFKDVLKEESKRMDREAYTEVKVSEKLIDILDLDFEGARIMGLSEKQYYIGRFRLDIKINKEDYTFKIIAVVSEYDNGRAPWVKRAVNPDEAKELIDLIEGEGDIRALTYDQEHDLQSRVHGLRILLEVNKEERKRIVDHVYKTKLL